MIAKEEINLNRAQNEIRILRRISGEEHLAQIVDSCEEDVLGKVYIFEKDAGKASIETLMKFMKHGVPLVIAKDLFR